jgi:hypothetical protein
VRAKARTDAVHPFDHMRYNRLPNWGACGRCNSDRPDSQRVGHSICIAYIPRGDESGWGDESPEPPPPPLDHRDAEDLDGYIRQLRARNIVYYHAIHSFFYIKPRPPVSNALLTAAISELLRMIDDNRATVRLMESRRREYDAPQR